MGKQLCEMHRARRRARIVTTALLAAFVATAAALAVYLVFRPLEPQAFVVRAAVYRMAAAAAGNSSKAEGRGPPPPYTLAASARFTTLLHNPSDRAAVFYDGLFAYMTYRGEMAAPPVPLPAVVQGRGADVALSPRFGLGGGGVGAVPVPVSADTAQALEGDCAARRVELRLVVMGRVKYRSGPFRTGWRGLYLRCDVTVGLGLGVDATAGGVEAGDVPLIEYPKCFVDA